MDVGKAFTFIWQDEDWIGKILVAGLCTLLAIFILPYILFVGYQLALMRNIVGRNGSPLPAWHDFGEMFKDGLPVAAAQFLYTIPIWLLACLATAASIIVSTNTASSDDAALAVSSVWIAVSCLMVGLAVILAFITPALYLQYLESGDFGSLFRLAEIFNLIRRHVKEIIITIVVAIAAGLFLSLAFTLLIWTICFPFLILFLGGAWINLASAHMYGQIAAKNAGTQNEDPEAMAAA